MTENRLLDLVDDRDFRTLFVEELGWNNPDRPDLTVEVDDETFTLQQVAGYKGLRIWHCPVLPPRKIQRQIDVLVGQDNQERLVIFTNEQRQEWRWPRRAQLGSANAKLLVHQHILGDRSTHLTQRLQAIELDFDEDLSLVALLDKMRDAFDHEAETASVAAARLMGTLYTELETCGVGEHDATLLLARLLFLMFGDDADMWKPEGLFERYLREHTTAKTLHRDLQVLFEVLDTDEKKRNLPADSPYAQFRYINGGLFHDPLQLPQLNSAFRHALIEACEFDWSIISPAVFGSMFQTVKSKESRRRGGEHYTTEENILKTIRPLFLDEYRERLDRAWGDKAQLTKLHNDLSRLRFLDPACGCGNFLIVAYRELRALELELLKRRRDLDMIQAASKRVERAQLSLDVTGDIKITLDHFFGIEIEEWPARIAETAMLLVDHLANQQMAVEFGFAPDRLPISIAPEIVHGNAVKSDWRQVLKMDNEHPADDVIILGNPPFIGMAWMNKEQQEDNRIAFDSLGKNSGLRTGRLDYVACWYAKAIKLISGSNGRAAFVSTNSITQGEQARTMVPLLARHEIKVDFGYRTFTWTSEAAKAAVVHVVIVGFSSTKRKTKKYLFDHETHTNRPVELEAERINFYLVDGPDLAPVKANAPLVGEMPMASKGSQPTDGGFLMVTSDELQEAQDDPIANRYLRKFVQSNEMLYDKDRWCLWLADASKEELQESQVIARRLEGVRESRLKSPTLSVRRQADTPHLFTQIRQPLNRYIALPEVSSENRKWIPGTFYDPNVIAGNKLIVWRSEELWHFGYLQSSIYMGWIRTYCGRLKSDYSISPGLIYFPFPFVIPNEEQKGLIEHIVQELLNERARFHGVSLADLYDPEGMPKSLQEKHYLLDRAVDQLYGLDEPTEAERMKAVLNRYEEVTKSLIK